jgi:pimeloyl-ACP methyl ester carboxylesterase
MSIEESEYLGIVQAIYAMPLIIDVSGRRTRSDFLYIDTKTGIPSLYLYDNGESTMISPGDQPITGSIALHNTNPWVAYAKDVGGAEDFAVYLLDYSKDEVTQVTKGTIGRINKLFWVTDDTWIVVGCDKQEYYIRLLHRDGSTEPLFLTDEQILTAAYDEKRNRVIAAVGRGPGTRIAVIDAHRTVTWVSESDTSEDTHPFICSEPEYLAYTTDVSGSTEIVVRTLSTLQEITRVEVPGSIGFLPGEGNIFWVDSKTIFAAVAKDAQLSPQLLDVTTGKWSHPLADISVLASTCTKEGPLWIGSSFSQPLSVQTLRNQKVVTVIQPDYTGTYVQSESHWYTSFDGQKIQGWLLRNPDPEAPLLVFCHGGPNFATLNMWAQGVLELVLAGYHVFAPNFRGSTTFGAEFKNLNIGDIGGGDLQDVLYGARYAMKVLGITRKPGIVGGSYGGYLTMQALTTQPDEWAGGVALVPWVDLIETHELGDAHYKALDTYLLGGTPEEKPELYRDRSPSTHLEKLKSPVLMIAGENDSRCPLPPIKNLYEKAQQLNLPVELEVIKQEGHGAVQISNLILFIILQLEFLKTLFPR